MEDMTMAASKLLRISEAAERLGLKPATIRKMLYRRELPVVRPTKRAVRIKEEDIEVLIKRHYTPARQHDRF